MPISSGFGGYTNTTRRKSQNKKPEKILSVSPVRKPVKIQPLYRVNSDDDLPSQRTIIVEDEPEEEVVHVVHRQRPKPKEKIIYVEEEPSLPQAQTKNIVYVDPPAPSATYVYSAKPASQPTTTQVVYTQQPPPPPTQVIYQQSPPQQQYVYANATIPRAQTVLVNEPQQVQYVLQDQPQYAYIDAMPASNVIFYNDPIAMNNMVTSVPSTSFIYR